MLCHRKSDCCPWTSSPVRSTLALPNFCSSCSVAFFSVSVQPASIAGNVGKTPLFLHPGGTTVHQYSVLEKEITHSQMIQAFVSMALPPVFETRPKAERGGWPLVVWHLIRLAYSWLSDDEFQMATENRARTNSWRHLVVGKAKAAKSRRKLSPLPR